MRCTPGPQRPKDLYDHARTPQSRDNLIVSILQARHNVRRMGAASLDRPQLIEPVFERPPRLF
ncbi:hypothetical protein DPMN_050898 [Dreissena polymorpha]|uniref:Uncharacterized protein n=1 Tax=Dreissena polymorpha TaxID=45954 RepID=A0A9D4CI47_DREPO|nr:hypothetical protein DPMN_050898 [Dreissena polymorpha]